jgi:ketosteroid isomerase-like protein
MKGIQALAVVVALVGGLSMALWAQTGNVEQTLIQMERDWAQALSKNDLAAQERIVAADWMVTSDEGQLMTKAQSDAATKSGATKYTEFAADDMNVRVFGDTAVVTGRSTMKGLRYGRNISGQERFTDVFVRRGGRWQAVSTQVTRIAKP